MAGVNQNVPCQSVNHFCQSINYIPRELNLSPVAGAIQNVPCQSISIQSCKSLYVPRELNLSTVAGVSQEGEVDTSKAVDSFTTQVHLHEVLVTCAATVTPRNHVCTLSEGPNVYTLFLFCFVVDGDGCVFFYAA